MCRSKLNVPWASHGTSSKEYHLPEQETQEISVQSLGSERSPGAGNGNLLQYYYLGNFMEREA